MIQIIENYVDKNFEESVLSLIPNKINKTHHRNQILRYGSRKPYAPIHISSEIPDIFLNLKDIDFDSVTINQYLKDQEVNWHIDRVDSGPKIYIISLLSDGVLKFRKESEHKEFLLPRFSLTIMSDDMRYNWEHYTKAEQPRVSVVFRNSKLS
jgi:alkylated DNA repair dioxygenase AlkB